MGRKWELEGGAAGLKGRRVEEYTDRYEFIKEAVTSAEYILRGDPCDADSIGKIVAAQAVLHDLAPSAVRANIEEAFQETLQICQDRGECRICQCGDQ